MAVNTSFGRLWPHCDAKRHLVTVVAPVSGARFPVHAGIAPLVAEGLRRMEHGIGGPAYVLDPKQCGGFNCRRIADTNSPSNHSGALAFDLDWIRNPFRKGARYALPEWVWRMWESLGFYWGGRYHDYMHFEWLKTPAAAADAVRRLLGGGRAQPVGRPTLRPGDRDDAVKEVQRAMGLPETAVYDDATFRRVQAFQRSRGLDADGICGPATWAALESTPPRRSSEDSVAIVQLPRTSPSNKPDAPLASWPHTEETVDLGAVKGWHGKCVIHLSFGHPGVHIQRAHIDTPKGDRTHVQQWVTEPGIDLEPAYKQRTGISVEVTEAGPATLMLTYAAPGGGSVNIEYEH